MPRWTRVPLLTLLTLIGLFVLTMQIFVVPELASEWARELPGFAYLAAPLAVCAIGAGLSVQVALVVAARLVGFLHRGRALDRAALQWVTWLVRCAAIGTIITLLALVALIVVGTGGPPALSLVLITAIIGGGTATLLLIVMRALLADAVARDATLREAVNAE